MRGLTKAEMFVVLLVIIVVFLSLMFLLKNSFGVGDNSSRKISGDALIDTAVESIANDIKEMAEEKTASSPGP